MTTLLPELTAQGLVLRRVRLSPGQQLWCSVRDGSGGLTLSLRNPATDQTSVAEADPSNTLLIDRGKNLRDQLVAAGWKAFDAERKAAPKAT